MIYSDLIYSHRCFNNLNWKHTLVTRVNTRPFIYISLFQFHILMTWYRSALSLLWPEHFWCQKKSGKKTPIPQHTSCILRIVGSSRDGKTIILARRNFFPLLVSLNINLKNEIKNDILLALGERTDCSVLLSMWQLLYLFFFLYIAISNMFLLGPPFFHINSTQIELFNQLDVDMY